MGDTVGELVDEGVPVLLRLVVTLPVSVALPDCVTDGVSELDGDVVELEVRLGEPLWLVLGVEVNDPELELDGDSVELGESV